MHNHTLVCAWGWCRVSEQRHIAHLQLWEHLEFVFKLGLPPPHGCFPKKRHNSTHLGTLVAILCMSFDALQKGMHPCKDCWGEPLEKGSPFYPMRGKPLVPGGFCAAIWCIIGDQEYFSNVLKLPHWASKRPCHQCNCTSKDGVLPYTMLDAAAFNHVDSDMARASPNPATQYSVLVV